MAAFHHSDEYFNKLITGVTRHILLVDDEKDIAYTTKVGLEHRGFKVTAFTEPMEAINDFRAGEYSILLTDIGMEMMDGYRLYRKLQEIDAKIKVCFLTGHPEYSREFRMYFPTLDEKCFITKPISLGQLADRISSIIDKKEE